MKEKIQQKWDDFKYDFDWFMEGVWKILGSIAEGLEVILGALAVFGAVVLAVFFALLFNALVVYAAWNILVEWLGGGPHMEAWVAVGIGIGWGLLNISTSNNRR